MGSRTRLVVSVPAAAAPVSGAIDNVTRDRVTPLAMPQLPLITAIFHRGLEGAEPVLPVPDCGDGGTRRPMTPRAAIAVLLALCVCGTAAAQTARTERTSGSLLGPRLAEKPGAILGIMGWGVVPDGSANAIQIDRGVRTDDGSDAGLVLGQLGAGFTWSSEFPLFLEGYIGYARYDPRFVLSGGEESRRGPTRWNSLNATIGIGWDFRLAENLYLRPIVNASLGAARSDAALFGAYVNYRTDIDAELFNKGQLNAWGLGGSLVLAYYDYKPARDIDIELRYTHIHLAAFGDTTQAARGTSEARAASIWARLRWPTGVEVFGGPLRWVIEGNNSYYLGDQQEALGFRWIAKVGGGIEFDLARHEIGAFGLYVTRVRLIGRYLFGDNNVQGYSFGLAMSF
jgi:hypothetical protein